MSNVTQLPNGSFQNRELALIKRTVAADTNDDEFNLFISYCNALKLDPRRRQIYALVYNKAVPSKRKMSIIVAIDGFRAVAARTGNYRPDDEEPRFKYDDAQKGPGNPLGLVKASVKVWQFSHGQWFPVTAAAHWDEYAPIKEDWSETRRIRDGEWPDGNPRYKNEPVEGATKVRKLDESGKWATMPRLMLSKVAEALALRKAWPDDFSAVYAEEEMDRATVIDVDPSQAAAQGAQEDRLLKIGSNGPSIMIDWLDSKAIEPVSTGKVADLIFAFIKEHKGEPSQIMQFSERNRHSLREFWAHSPGDALEVKKAMEQAIQNATEQA